jgi:hypothetical protein
MALHRGKISISRAAILENTTAVIRPIVFSESVNVDAVVLSVMTFTRREGGADR